jgi:hypothetical protein
LLRDLEMIEIVSCSEFLAGNSICQRWGCFGSCGTFSVSSPHFCFDPESHRRADIALGQFSGNEKRYAPRQRPQRLSAMTASVRRRTIKEKASVVDIATDPSRFNYPEPAYGTFAP